MTPLSRRGKKNTATLCLAEVTSAAEFPRWPGSRKPEYRIPQLCRRRRPRRICPSRTPATSRSGPRASAVRCTGRERPRRGTRSAPRPCGRPGRAARSGRNRAAKPGRSFLVSEDVRLLIALRSALGYQDGHGHGSDRTAGPAHRQGDAGWLGDEDSTGIAGVVRAAGRQFDLAWRRTDGLAA